jgi:hypothetical protein
MNAPILDCCELLACVRRRRPVEAQHFDRFFVNANSAAKPANSSAPAEGSGTTVTVHWPACS